MIAAAGAAPRRIGRGPALAGLGLALAVAAVLAAAIGAVRVSPGEVLAALLEPLGIRLPWAPTAQEATIVLMLRLPRVALAALVGAGLAAAGAALQGAVRNPLADPGLVGVASGAALGAVAAIVLGAPLVAALPALGPYLAPAAAFVASLITTGVVVLRVRRPDGRASGVALVLGGVAIASVASAATGLLVLIADDAQLRSITFWSLGSLAGASWPVVALAGVPTAIALVLLPRFAGALDRLLLGEREARHLGVDVDRCLRRLAGAVALAVGAAVAVCGVIGFVGLVVPHLVRGWLGPAHATLIPASALAGALLLVLADLVARTVATPIELPVGVITALVGGPVLYALVRGGREVTP